MAALPSKTKIFKQFTAFKLKYIFKHSFKLHLKPGHFYNVLQLQATARVSRLFEEDEKQKQFGFILDYEGLLGELGRAHSAYSAFEGFEK